MLQVEYFKRIPSMDRLDPHFRFNLVLITPNKTSILLNCSIMQMPLCILIFNVIKMLLYWNELFFIFTIKNLFPSQRVVTVFKIPLISQIMFVFLLWEKTLLKSWMLKISEYLEKIVIIFLKSQSCAFIVKVGNILFYQSRKNFFRLHFSTWHKVSIFPFYV